MDAPPEGKYSVWIGACFLHAPSCAFVQLLYTMSLTFFFSSTLELNALRWSGLHCELLIPLVNKKEKKNRDKRGGKEKTETKEGEPKKQTKRGRTKKTDQKRENPKQMSALTAGGPSVLSMSRNNLTG